MKIEIPAAIAAERQRQIAAEGWTPEHDDAHDNGELLAAARMYFQISTGGTLVFRQMTVRRKTVPLGWPWDPSWWKPKTPARNLERAGALCMAEIDRLARRQRPTSAVEETLGQIVAAYNGLSA